MCNTPDLAACASPCSDPIPCSYDCMTIVGKSDDATCRGSRPRPDVRERVEELRRHLLPSERNLRAVGLRVPQRGHSVR
jgi:hypothetical protein